MHKLILTCSVMIGLAAPFAATAAPVQNSLAAQPMALNVVAISVAPKPSHIQNEVLVLQRQVQALQNQRQNENSYNLAELANLPLGG